MFDRWRIVGSGQDGGLCCPVVVEMAGFRVDGVLEFALLPGIVVEVLAISTLRRASSLSRSQLLPSRAYLGSGGRPETLQIRRGYG